MREPASLPRKQRGQRGDAALYPLQVLGQGGGGSDHSSFAAVKKPYVYYMTAMHSDYHQTSDSPEQGVVALVLHQSGGHPHGAIPWPEAEGEPAMVPGIEVSP